MRRDHHSWLSLFGQNCSETSKFLHVFAVSYVCDCYPFGLILTKKATPTIVQLLTLPHDHLHPPSYLLSMQSISLLSMTKNVIRRWKVFESNALNARFCCWKNINQLSNKERLNERGWNHSFVFALDCENEWISFIGMSPEIFYLSPSWDK
jgi:hypothetical protein